MAEVLTLDFTKVKDKRQTPTGIPGDDISSRPHTTEGLLLTPKQIRARARRRLRRQAKRQIAVTETEFNALYKPIEDWDMEELARGRPRSSNGKFAAKAPSWITREVHERAMERFKMLVKTELSAATPQAMQTVHWILTNDEEDEKGRAKVPASVKLSAAQLLIEHAVGKPKQVIENDVSVRLQGILGVVMANPNDALANGSDGGRSPSLSQPAYVPAHFPGVTLELGTSDDEPIDAEYEEDDSSE